MSDPAFPDHVPVLVVGAGPTGLTAAALLAEREIPALTVEKRSGITSFSKAIGIQPRTLELFEKLGITHEINRLGLHIQRVVMYRDGEVASSLEIGEAGAGQSPYPNITTLDQAETERVLLAAAVARGADIRWETEVVSMRHDQDGVDVVLEAGGERHQVRADWVVGADGASSIVRKASGQTFDGGTYEEGFMLLDARMEGLPQNAVTLDLLEQGILAFFPLPEPNRFRTVATLHDIDDPDGLTRDEIVELTRQRSSIDLQISDPRWSSTYRLHHRKVDEFRVGRMLIAGDAAHVHSPAGGQGMNTGIGDAFNLVWKLELVLNGLASPELMQTYDDEREPFAEVLLATTDRAFEFIVGRSPVSGAIKRRALPPLVSTLGNVKMMQREVFRRVSQIAIEYPDSRLSIGTRPWLGPNPGERVPPVSVGNGETLFDRISSYQHHLVVFGDEEDTASLVEAVAPLGGRVEVIRLPPDSEAAEELGAKSGSGRLLRPDGHIAVVADGDNALADLQSYFDELGDPTR